MPRAQMKLTSLQQKNYITATMVVTVFLLALPVVKTNDNPTVEQCNSLLCKDKSVVSRSCDVGRYLAADCTCIGCPTEPGTAGQQWRFICLTATLGVCPAETKPPGPAETKPPGPAKPNPGDCPGVCSTRSVKCTGFVEARFPDSACVCVPCSSATVEAGDDADALRLLQCARSMGFCAVKATTMAANNVTDPTSTPPLGDCTEQELMECRNCSSSVSEQHYQNGSCRACPHRRDADRQCQDPPPSHAALIVICVVFGIALCVVVFLVRFKRQRLPCCKQGGTEGPLECNMCKKLVQDRTLPVDGDYCKCRIYRTEDNDEMRRTAGANLPLLQQNAETNGTDNDRENGGNLTTMVHTGNGATTASSADSAV